METELKKYDKYKRKVEFVAATSGLWLDHETQPAFVGIFLCFCSVITSIATFYGAFAFCIKHITNIILLTKGLGLIITLISAPLKICLIRLYREEIRALNSGVSRLFSKDLETSEYHGDLLTHLGIFTMFVNLLNYLLAMMVTFIVLVPVWFIPRGKYLSMYPHELPFSYVPGGTMYWLIFSIHFIASFFMWSTNAAFDALFGYYTLHLVGELRLLTSRFRALKSCDNYKQTMKDCIRRHVVLTKTHHLLEKIFGFFAIWLTVTCAIILCALVFQAYQMKNISTFRICYLLFYTSTKLVQAFYYAWYGQIINVESETCLKAMYDAYWPGSGNRHFMNDVLIVLSQKPLVFHAKSIMILGLDKFTKVVHATISYFFLLRTLNENLG